MTSSTVHDLTSSLESSSKQLIATVFQQIDVYFEQLKASFGLSRPLNQPQLEIYPVDLIVEKDDKDEDIVLDLSYGKSQVLMSNNKRVSTSEAPESSSKRVCLSSDDKPQLKVIGMIKSKTKPKEEKSKKGFTVHSKIKKEDSLTERKRSTRATVNSVDHKHGKASSGHQLQSSSSAASKIKVEEEEEKYLTEWLDCPAKNCKKTVQTRLELDRHLLQRHHLDPYQCLLHQCGRRFENLTFLQLHLINDHSTIKTWICAHCQRAYSSSDALYKHEYGKHQSGSFVCPNGRSSGCCYKAPIRSKVVAHSQQCKPKTARRKEPPGDSSTTTVDDQVGVICKYTVSAIKCTQCDEWLMTTVALKRHLEDVHQVLAFQCAAKGCGQSFSVRKHLSDHIHAKHCHLTTWHCSQCPQTFTYGSSLSQHIIHYHHEGSFDCVRCQFKAKCRGDVIEHWDREHV